LREACPVNPDNYREAGEVGCRKTLKRVGDTLIINILFMKKYLFGLAAVVFALSLVAFTNVKRANEKDFRFTGSLIVEAQVENPALWFETTNLSCPGDAVNACVILEVPDTYYHFDGTRDILNTTASGGDLAFAITATKVANPGTTYYVTSVTAASGAAIDNKE
jgi:hypothetical protein